jgi:cell envelope opacity-associated protein A
MQTFSQALIDLVLRGEVDQEIAANAATNRHDFLVALESAAKRQRAAEAQAEEQPAQPDGVVALEPELPGEEPLSLRIVRPAEA